MDEGLGDEVAPVELAEGARLWNKEAEYSPRPPESSNMESREMIAPREGNFPESSYQILTNVLEGKNIDSSVSYADASEQPCASSGYMDGVGNMVKELTMRNYDGSNLAIVGSSNSRERIQTRQSQWQRLYNLGGGSGTGSSLGNFLYKGHGQPMPGTWEDPQYAASTDFLDQKTMSEDCNGDVEQLANAEHNGVSSNMIPSGGIRTKILSKSGFSEFFVKKTLKGKGTIFRGPPHDGMRPQRRDQNNGKVASGTLIASNALPSLGAKAAIPSSFVITGPKHGVSDHDGVSLREWLDVGRLKLNKQGCLNIFRKIVDLVDYSHSQGTALHEIRPLCFKLMLSNQVKYIGSTSQNEILEGATGHDITLSENESRRRPIHQGMFLSFGVLAKKQRFSENTDHIRQWPPFTAKYGFKPESARDGDLNAAGTRDSPNETDEHNLDAELGNQGKSSSHQLSNTVQQQLKSVSEQLEQKWYASPEELNEGICTNSSNVYSLGVLLFELLGHFDSKRSHATAMLDLRHRILPPHFLSENPKEAGFCLWLLHPEPLSRPTTREILQSEVLQGLQDVSAAELSSSIDQDDAESELLLHFLMTLREQREKDACKLVEDIRCLDADIRHVERRNYGKNPSIDTFLETDYLMARENNFQHEAPGSEAPKSNTKEPRLMSNIGQLERAYFTMRSKAQLPETDANMRQEQDLLRNCKTEYFTQEIEKKQDPTDCIGVFFDGLCKYARYSKFVVRGLMRTGEFNNSANVICSLSFDRDADYFAAAGVSKKIKIFEFNALFNDTVDIHYPVIEMSNKTKLSCICWNSYIKNYLASTGYDGMVKLWDASTGQEVFQYSEHDKRAWSVDFSQVHPTKLASGSDDYTVKLWSINEKNSLSTIRNIANVCCVQFSSHSTHLLAFGSADYRTYCYDLRNVRTPWCVLAGHDKAVSYAKFLDSQTLVTASTDNSLKVWDLNKTSSGGLSTTACSLTLSGHTNEKNFVGLSVADGYIACGSETNEVYAYYRSLPMPITSHKFGSINPISGKDTDDDNGQFVSSVCWRGNSDMIVAANSSGCIKVLQMV